MLAIIQARMSSTRLPGKVLRTLYGDPLLSWVVQRVAKSLSVKKIIVATSFNSEDDPIEDFCNKSDINCFRGSLNDVVNRFTTLLAAEDCDHFLRVCGDSPLIDPALIDYAELIYRTGDFEVVTNAFQKSYPKGQSVEVIQKNAFIEKLASQNLSNENREHLTKYFYENSDKFKLHNFFSGIPAHGIQLSVDTAEDFEKIRRLIEMSNGVPGGWRELFDLSRDLE